MVLLNAPVGNVYDMGFLNSSVNILNLTTGIGTAIGDPFLIGTMIFISFFVITFVVTYRDRYAESMIISGFLTGILGVLLGFAGMLQMLFAMVPFIIAVVGLVMYFTT